MNPTKHREKHELLGLLTRECYECGTNGINNKSMHNFGVKISQKAESWKTDKEVAGYH